MNRNITLDTAERLTGLSRRTLRRRLAVDMPRQERLRRVDKGYIPLRCLRGDLPGDLGPEDERVIVLADQGYAEAQHHVALMQMEAGFSDLAIYWLEQAAAQDYPDAMHWLGRCHVSGEGVEEDEIRGLDWLRRAAAKGHIISQKQLEGLSPMYVFG